MMKDRSQVEYELKRERADRTLPYMQTLRWRTCRKKRRIRQEAESMATEYNQRVVFGTLNYYSCWRHNAWHVGHSHKRLASALALSRKYDLE